MSTVKGNFLFLTNEKQSDQKKNKWKTRHGENTHTKASQEPRKRKIEQLVLMNPKSVYMQDLEVAIAPSPMEQGGQGKISLIYNLLHWWFERMT